MCDSKVHISYLVWKGGTNKDYRISAKTFVSECVAEHRSSKSRRLSGRFHVRMK